MGVHLTPRDNELLIAFLEVAGNENSGIDWDNVAEKAKVEGDQRYNRARVTRYTFNRLVRKLTDARMTADEPGVTRRTSPRWAPTTEAKPAIEGAKFDAKERGSPIDKTKTKTSDISDTSESPTKKTKTRDTRDVKDIRDAGDNAGRGLTMSNKPPTAMMTDITPATKDATEHPEQIDTFGAPPAMVEEDFDLFPGLRNAGNADNIWDA